MTPRLRARALVVTIAVAGLVAAAGSSAAGAPAAGDNGLTVVAVRHSLLGTHSWYQQTVNGIPVLGGFYATHTDNRTGEVIVQDGRLTVNAVQAFAATVTQDRAQAAALARTGGDLLSSQLAILPGEAGQPHTLAWRVLSDTDRGTMQSLVDARSGSVVKVDSLVKEANGTGVVFEPNAVVTLQNESLTDNNNANSAVFGPAYKTVTLTQLNNTGQLRGAYARNVSNNPVTSNSRTFNFNRSQRGFEQVMGYYHITRAQEYIHTLGFTDVNNSAQAYRTTGLTDDNSFYDPSVDRITFGTGGVDDAEDAEVIWHEYGHAIQDDQVPGFGSTLQAGSIGEGFGDYWAFTMSIPVSAATATTPLACIADWDSVSYTTGVPHCLRRVDGKKVYPRDSAGEVHADGEIWSRALFDIHNALGRTQANTIVLEAQFGFASNTTFAAAANKIVATAQALYGAQAAAACQAAMHARGFI
jgi:Zn-dependent metalloprotease